MFTQTTKSDVDLAVERFTIDVNRMMNWDADSLNDLIYKLTALIGYSRGVLLNKKNRQDLRDLGEKFEDRITQLICGRTENYIRWFDEGSINPRQMLEQRGEFRYLSVDAPTANLRKELRMAAREIQNALDQSSEKIVDSYVVGAENSIAYAQEVLAFAKEEGDLQSVENSLRRAEGNLTDVRRKNHLWYVGLPRVAEKREMSAEDLYNSLWQQIRDAWQAFAPLWLEAEEEKKRQAMITMVALLAIKREEERQEQERQAETLKKLRDQSIESIVCSIERRNKQAGKMARQFLEHIKLGNAGAAWSCLNTITRLDGGVDPVLMAEHRKIAK
jgi:hypothetical protein